MTRENLLAPELLLTHLEWVRALVRSLIADAHLAEDIAQETMLAALRRPPESPERPRAWLGVVARNLALKWRRGEQRRVRRERGAPSPGPAPSSQELVERAALQREVVGLVLQLEEPYRSTLLERFYAGRTPRQIARRAGLSPETVKTRLRRGLARLRERLREEEGGEAEWLAALLPLARPLPVAAVPAATAAGALTGVVMMSAKIKVVLGLALSSVVGIGAWQWQRSSGEPASPPRESVASTREATREPLPSAPAAPGEGALRRAEPPEAAPESKSPLLPLPVAAAGDSCRLAGKVLGPVAEPAASAWVILSDSDHDTLGSSSFAVLSEVQSLLEEEPGEHRRRVRTGSEGEYSFDDLPPGHSWSLFAFHETLGVGMKFGVPLDLDDSPQWLDLRLEGGVVLHGEVTDPSGGPVAAALVQLFGHDENGNGSSVAALRTDARGRYRFFPLPYSGFELSLHADGFLWAVERLSDVAAGEVERRVDFVLERSPRLAGRILDLDGEPAGLVALVRASSGAASASLRLYASGRHPAESPSFLGFGHDRGTVIAAEDRYEFQAEYPGNRYLSLWLGEDCLGVAEIVDPMVGPDFHLDPGALPAAPPQGSLEVQVLDAADRAPVETLQLSLRPMGERADLMPLELTGMDESVPGLRRLDGIPVGSYRAWVSTRDRVPSWQSVEIQAGGLARLEFVLQRPTARIDGIVRDPGGRPLPAATVMLLRADGESPDLFGVPRRETNQDGEFAFSELAPARYRVLAHPTGDDLAPVLGWVEADPEGYLELQPPAGHAVRVFPQGTEGPFRFRVRDASGTALLDDRRDGSSRYGEGPYVFVLAAGDYTIDVLCSGYECRPVAFTAGPSTHVELPLTRRGPGSVAGAR